MSTVVDRKEYLRAYYQTHREEIRARVRDWQAANFARRQEVVGKYYETHKAEILEYEKRYRIEHLDKITESKKTKEYREYKNNYDKGYRLENQELVRMKKHLRRTAEGRFSADDIKGLLIMQAHKCANMACRKSLKRYGYHIDHVMPISKGGSNWPENLQLLCPHCNLSKHDKDPEDWARKNGMLFC